MLYLSPQEGQANTECALLLGIVSIAVVVIVVLLVPTLGATIINVTNTLTRLGQ